MPLTSSRKTGNGSSGISEFPTLLLSDYHHSWVELAKEKMTEQVANEGRPHVDRPQQCEPTFYNINGRPSQFYVPPRPYETEEDLKDFWVL
jgi:hypothetical protein